MATLTWIFSQFRFNYKGTADPCIVNEDIYVRGTLNIVQMIKTGNFR
jgi:hypothetical protein